MQEKSKNTTTVLIVVALVLTIVILAVALIMTLLDKKSEDVVTFEDSVQEIIRAGENYYNNVSMTEDKEFIIENGAFVGDALSVSGSLPSSGKITITKEGKVAVAITNGEKCAQKATTEQELTVKEQANCEYKKSTNTVFTTSSESNSIPTCITGSDKCEVGTKVAVKVNDTETYDFYVIEDNTETGKVSLIMNKNLGDTVAWVTKEDYIAAGGTETDWGEYKNKNKGPVTALKVLEERTANWTNIPYSAYQLNGEGVYTNIEKNTRARLMTKSEATTLLSLSNNSWLYENLAKPPYGYWTSSATDYPVIVWYGNYNSNNFQYGVQEDNTYGIRPVITISKTIL